MEKNLKNRPQSIVKNLKFKILVYEVYGRCREYLESGSPLPEHLNKYFKDVEEKFRKKINF